MNDLIIDFETLGVNTMTCPVVDCSFLTFDRERFISDDPYKFEELVEAVVKTKFDVEEQVKKFGFKPEQATIDWWMTQDKDVRKQVLPSNQDISVSEWIDIISKFVQSKKVDNCWARGVDFDAVILRRLLDYFDKKYVYENHLQFWKWRDTRSFLDGFSLFEAGNTFSPMEDESAWNKMFKKHDSAHDIAADTLRLQTIWRIKNGLEV